MNFKLSLKQRLINALEIAGRKRVRHELMAMSDHQLNDMGFSRKKLQQGVKAWPWRETAATVEILRNDSNIAFSTDEKESQRDFPRAA